MCMDPRPKNCNHWPDLIEEKTLYHEAVQLVLFKGSSKAAPLQVKGFVVSEIPRRPLESSCSGVLEIFQSTVRPVTRKIELLVGRDPQD